MIGSSFSGHFRHSNDAEARMRPPTDGRQWPMLVLDTGDCSSRVYVTPEFSDTSYRITAEHVRFATELLQAAIAYSSEVMAAFEHDHQAEFGVMPGHVECLCDYCVRGEATNAA